MRATLLALLLSPLLVLSTQAPSGRFHRKKPKRAEPAVSYVLICESRSAYAYHGHMCHGLNRCRSAVSRVSRAQAAGSGYLPCRICY
ncbi:hypothetical protein [Arsenicibacter rosenii]|uniref:hypothetical protein n=1 Tax=Arsenicibacter rosenii TaxID=1750698 RepID=UPI00116014CE|nr:hypothetical protein [Arsenicibacter rosenii]